MLKTLGLHNPNSLDKEGKKLKTNLLFKESTFFFFLGCVGGGGGMDILFLLFRESIFFSLKNRYHK